MPSSNVIVAWSSSRTTRTAGASSLPPDDAVSYFRDAHDRTRHVSGPRQLTRLPANHVTTDAATRQGSDASISLRPIRPDDQPFLLAVYASTRRQELAVVPWDDAQKVAFIRMQFEAQHAFYQEHYEGQAFDVILVGGTPAG